MVDTGGIIFDDTKDIFAERITQQALIALNQAQAAILVCDGQEGVTQLDTIIAEWLRKHSKVPVYVAVNKCESHTQGLTQAQEFWELGLGQPYPVSGIHGSGIAELLDDITTKHLPKVTHVLRENATNVALVGRPNVGKSSLFNRYCLADMLYMHWYICHIVVMPWRMIGSARVTYTDTCRVRCFCRCGCLIHATLNNAHRPHRLLGEDRSIVSNEAGTTRDTVDALLRRANHTYRFVDTAGIRKRGKVEYGPEFFMVNR